MDYFLDLSRVLTYSQFSKALMNESPLSASTYQGSLMAWPYVNEVLACVFAEHPAEDITSAILFEIAESFHIVWSLKKMARSACRAEPEGVTKAEALSAPN